MLFLYSNYSDMLGTYMQDEHYYFLCSNAYSDIVTQILSSLNECNDC